jgi:ribosome biogenesis GTPase
MNYQVLRLTLRLTSESEHAALLNVFVGKTTLVLGPSGAGKSTLINLLKPGALAQTGEISQALNSGKHTTTRTTWYWVDDNRTTALIDSPGFQEFGLNHIEPAKLAHYMPDLQSHSSDCKFYNCSHLHEPGCGVISAVDSGDCARGISVNRYKIYSDLYAELKQIRRY